VKIRDVLSTNVGRGYPSNERGSQPHNRLSLNRVTTRPRHIRPTHTAAAAGPIKRHPGAWLTRARDQSDGWNESSLARSPLSQAPRRDPSTIPKRTIPNAGASRWRAMLRHRGSSCVSAAQRAGCESRAGASNIAPDPNASRQLLALASEKGSGCGRLRRRTRLTCMSRARGRCVVIPSPACVSRQRRQPHSSTRTSPSLSMRAYSRRTVFVIRLVSWTCCLSTVISSVTTARFSTVT
jgi:hypothetical protein